MEASRRWIAALWLATVVLQTWACGESTDPKAGGETHWLAACTDDGDCGTGQCICHICSRGCGGDGACAQDGVPARCIETSSTALDRACDDRRSDRPDAVCIADCGPDASCAPGLACSQGACIPAGSTLDTLPTLDPRDFADAAVQLDFDQPLVVPRPRRTFDGDAPSLAGEWLEDCTGLVAHDPGCMTLSLQPDVSGTGMVGTASFKMADPAYPLRFGNLEIPLQPATDADMGYPPGHDESSLVVMLGFLLPEVAYRLLDARHEPGRLSFWISPVDLWSDWCAMQTSYLFVAPDDAADVGGPSPGRRSYRCVPQINPGDIDPNKWDLCADYTFSGLEACGDDGSCIGSACSCDASDCVAATTLRAMRYELTIEGDSMVLTSSDGAQLNTIAEGDADPAAGLYPGEHVPLRLHRAMRP